MPECLPELSEVFVPGEGPSTARVMIIGEAPGQTEEELQRPFVGAAGKLLELCFEEVGLCRKDLYITNAVKHRPPNNRTPKVKEIEAQRGLLIDEIRAVNPELIIPLGNVALRSLLGKRAPKISDARGQLLELEEDGKRYLLGATYHPAAALRNPSLEVCIVEDLKRVLNGSSSRSEEELNYILAEPNNLTQFYSELSDATVASVDVETTGLNSFDKDQKLISFAVCFKPGESWLFLVEHKDSKWKNPMSLVNVVDQLRYKQLIGHNFKFDLHWLLRYFALSAHDFKAIRDTRILWHLIDENYPDLRLKHLALMHTPIGEQLKKAQSKLNVKALSLDTPVEDLMMYNCGDTDATLRLYNEGKKRLKAESGKLWKFYLFQCEALRMFTDVEQQGVKVDVKRKKEVEKVLLDELNPLKDTLMESSGIENLNSNAQLANFLYSENQIEITKFTKTKAPSVDKDALDDIVSRCSETHPKVVAWVKDLLHYRKLSKNVNTYLVNLELDDNNFIHCSFKIESTTTGRLACSSPNLQNQPREGLIKTIYRSRWKNGKIVQADFSQAELRLLAHLANERNLIKAFENGRDLHQEVASRVFKVSYDKVSSEQRTYAKRINFGIVYCITSFGLARDLGVSKFQAQRFMDSWFREFPGVKQYIERMGQLGEENGYVEDLFGRRRRGDLSRCTPGSYDYQHLVNQFVNSPIQGPASHLTVYAMYSVWKWLRKQELDSRIVLNVHDAIYVDCPAGEVDKVQAHMVYLCERTQLSTWGINLKVPLKVDVEASTYWGDKKE